MDWFLYDNGLRHERVNREKPMFEPLFKTLFKYLKISKAIVTLSKTLENSVKNVEAAFHVVYRIFPSFGTYELI